MGALRVLCGKLRNYVLIYRLIWYENCMCKVRMQPQGTVFIVA